MNMNNLTHNKKFTVICSAYQAKLSAFDNMINTELLAKHLMNTIFVESTRAVGVYRGVGEQSFVINTNSASKVNLIVSHCLGQYNQECVLVSNNQRHAIELWCINCLKHSLGSNFGVQTTKPDAHVEAYTVLNGTDYYVVY